MPAERLSKRCLIDFQGKLFALIPSVTNFELNILSWRRIIAAVVQIAPHYISPLFLTSLGTYAIGAFQLQLALLL